MFWIPMAIGAGIGALTNKDPLKGAVMGAGMGAATGGLGALGAGAGAAGAGATGAGANLAAMGGGQGLLAGTSAAGGLAGNAAQGLSMGASGGLLAGGAQGLTAAPGVGTALTAATNPAASGLGGLLSKDNMKTVGDVAGLAQKAGVFNDPPTPQAQSAGIPGRGGVDFSGLLSAGRANNVSGAQLLAQQRAARRGA